MKRKYELEILVMVMLNRNFLNLFVINFLRKERFNHLMENKEIIDLELSKGAKKARLLHKRYYKE